MTNLEIPGQDLIKLGIRIKYSRDPWYGTVKNTIAWRHSGQRIHFGIVRYNPKDKITEGIQPTKKIGRNLAIERLYEAEKSLYDSTSAFQVEEGGVTGCCKEEEIGFMLDWFIGWA